ncbi:TPA: hypothetical protein ACK3JW_001223 [Mannheimia haemolytica]
MEWQGIDLSAHRKNSWLVTSYKRVKNVVYTLLLSALLGVVIIFYYLQKNQQIQPLVQQLEQIKTEILNIENKIIALTSHHKNTLPFADAKKIAQLLEIIHKLPLKNGGIEVIQIYIENELYLKISGNLDNEADFKNLEHYLYHQDLFETKTEQINVNHKNETQFIFTLKYKGS